MNTIQPYPVRVDLHVHTRRYSACAESLDPDQLPLLLDSSGLNGLVITEHDHLWPVQDIRALNRRLVRGHIFRGVEVSSRNGHFILIGLDHMQGIHPGIDVFDLVKIAEGQQAAVIWAHPQLCYQNIPEPSTVHGLPRGIDAVEVASVATDGVHTRRAIRIAEKLELAQVGGSDAHITRQVGCAATLLQAMPRDEKELALAIRNGFCRASSPFLES